MAELTAVGKEWTMVGRSVAAMSDSRRADLMAALRDGCCEGTADGWREGWKKVCRWVDPTDERSAVRKVDRRARLDASLVTRL